MARVWAVAGVLILAAGLRFYKLGVWSFAGDELATTREAGALFGLTPVPPGSQFDRLPRIAPLVYAAHQAGYALFGTDEFGARAVPAALGSALPALAVLLLWRPLGGWAAAATGLLLALSPEAVLRSQENRFYAPAAFAAGGCVLTAAAAAHAGSVRAFAAACGFALVAPLVHPVLAALAPGLLAAAALAPGPRRRAFVFAGGLATLGVVVIVGVYQLPLMRGWNAGAGWGYSVAHAVSSGVNRAGLPTVLLAGVGAVLMVRRRHPARWFWAVWGGGWFATLVALPPVLAYHPAYSFPLALGPTAVAGYAVGEVTRLLAADAGRAAAVAWVGAACLFNLPALGSHYADGSRPDHRAAARLVALRRQPGEAVAAASPGNLAYYRASLSDAAGLDTDRLLEELEAVGRRGRVTWLVLPAGRARREEDVQDWLNRHARLERTFRRFRVDAYEFTLDVYKFDPAGR